ncbi:hypothetical protein [Pseudomonas peli]|uniref:hypothetical protein n=1 Tax=Pseudomonas peli TaxID=592361 RepID=UPI0024ADCE71|nr:hypothetical protein [Pseudomonas peli]
MKKIIVASLVAGLFASINAQAATTTAPTAVTLTANGYVAMGNVTTNINLARQFAITAVAARAGFVKNDFEATLSANVIAGAFDNAANNRFGVIAGSNKGYNVFTGSSVGGSVAQCGKPAVKADDADLAAKYVEAGSLALANANGCNRPL